jgi:NAD(P)-dependent dehydrogenase (short-subunit alcohol dehydrogenase family)
MLQGRYALITGASLGFGAEIARHFVAAGASVMLCARGAKDLEAIRAELSPKLQPDQQVLTQVADVAVQEDVAALFRTTLAAFPRLDILVNNAGVYGPMGRLEEIDVSDWVQAIGINLFGTVYCCHAALPAMRRAGYGKIINLSGGGATAPLPYLSSYAAAKAAVVRLTETLALEAAEANIDINAVAPGALATRLLEDVTSAGPERVGVDFHRRMLKIRDDGGTPLEVGARLCVFLASAKSDGITGKLISAPWDRWQDWPEHLEALRGSDAYTLRRITGRDRGIPWGDV